MSAQGIEGPKRYGLPKDLWDRMTPEDQIIYVQAITKANPVGGVIGALEQMIADEPVTLAAAFPERASNTKD